MIQRRLTAACALPAIVLAAVLAGCESTPRAGATSASITEVELVLDVMP